MNLRLYLTIFLLVLEIGPYESWWLNGKLGRSGFVVMKDSKWEPSDIADTEWIGGSAPTFDLNAERNLYIRTKDKKLGADPGDFTLKGFICEYKKRGYLYALNNLCGFIIYNSVSFSLRR